MKLNFGDYLALVFMCKISLNHLVILKKYKLLLELLSTVHVVDVGITWIL